MIKNFNGKPMKIKKTGAVYPVDVELKTEDGKDILYISADVKFVDFTAGEYDADDAWREAVLDGFRSWKGEYKVFGNQPVTVKVDVRETSNFTDSIIVIYIDEEMREEIQNVSRGYNNKRAEKLWEQNRSFATAGFPLIGWKAYLPKMIFMLPHTLRTRLDACITAKHEFGHVLGLGDLYRDLENGLCGVDGAEYEDISKYYIGDSFFDMVMCNNGPVRDNDIEMVLLAFQTNSFQNYQKVKQSDKISEALGNGN